MAGIFISYRRDDAQGWAGRLTEDLQRNLPGVRVFRDIDTIPAGTQFADYTVDAVASCDVLIALIGPRWATATDDRGNRRLDDPRDLTRLEIAAALRRNVRVIPTLVSGAALPRREDLPDDLQPLLTRQSFQLEDRAWKDDVTRLVAVLAPLVGVRRRGRTAMVAAAAAVVVVALVGYASVTWFGGEHAGPAPPQSTLREAQTASAPQPQNATPSQSLSRDLQPPDPAAATERPPAVKTATPPPVSERANVERALLDAHVKARSAYASAANWLERAEKAATSARASANEAVRASGDAKAAFPTRASYEAAQLVIAPVRKNAAAASQAAGRAEEAVRRVREAVGTAEASALAASKATDPAAAARAASAAGAAEDAARTLTGDVEKEAEAAAQYAKESAIASGTAVAQSPGATIHKASCVALGQARYRVELTGEAKGPPTSTLSIHVSGNSGYGFDVDLICTAWRPGRRGDGSEDRSRCANGDIASPLTRWTATVIFQPRGADVPPYEASASIFDSEGRGRTLAAVSLQCQ